MPGRPGSWIKTSRLFLSLGLIGLILCLLTLFLFTNQKDSESNLQREEGVKSSLINKTTLFIEAKPQVSSSPFAEFKRMSKDTIKTWGIPPQSKDTKIANLNIQYKTTASVAVNLSEGDNAPQENSSTTGGLENKNGKANGNRKENNNGTRNDNQNGNKTGTRNDNRNSNSSEQPQSAPDVLENITLEVTVLHPDGDPIGNANVMLYAPQNENGIPFQAQGRSKKYTLLLTRGINIKKQYWIKAISRDGLSEGNAIVPKPTAPKVTLPITIKLVEKRNINFKLTVLDQQGNTLKDAELFLWEKEPALRIKNVFPDRTDNDGKAEGQSRVNPQSEYIVKVKTKENEEAQVEISKDDLRGIGNNESINKEIRVGEAVAHTGLTVKVISIEGETHNPVSAAKIILTPKDNTQPALPYTSDHDGMVKGISDYKDVGSITVEAKGYDDVTCLTDGSENRCEESNNIITVRLTKQKNGSSSVISYVIGLIKSVAGVSLILGIIGLFLVGVVILNLDRIRSHIKKTQPDQSNDQQHAPKPVNTAPAIDQPGNMSVSKQVSTVSDISQTPPPQTPQTKKREDKETHDTIPQVNKQPRPQSGTANKLQPLISKPSSVRDNLTPLQQAKEDYRRLILGEEIQRQPIKLEIVFNNKTDDQTFEFNETKDIGAKFILFTNSEDEGLLFPNPAQNVFQREDGQTWRLVFNGLSKDEFGRRKGKLNPIEARRELRSEGRRRWVAKAKNYRFE